MSDLLFVKRYGNGNLQYCVPLQGYEWPITPDSPPRPLSSKQPDPPEKQEEKAQKRWSLGPWQHVKLRPATTPCERNPLFNSKLHAGAPFCSLVSNANPYIGKLEATPPSYTPPWVVHKQEELTLRQKAIMKARSATVLPVVALSKHGEWVPPSSGRKAHARLTTHCNGGWSKTSVSPLVQGARATHDETGDLPHKDQNKGAEHFSFGRPDLNSSAFLLHKLHVAEEELKKAQASMCRASAFLEYDLQGPEIKDHHPTRGSKGAGKAPQGTEAQPLTSAKHADKARFSARSSCIRRNNKNKR